LVISANLCISLCRPDYIFIQDRVIGILPVVRPYPVANHANHVAFCDFCFQHCSALCPAASGSDTKKFYFSGPMVKIHQYWMIRMVTVKARTFFEGVKKLASLGISCSLNFTVATAAPSMEFLIFLGCLFQSLLCRSWKIVTTLLLASRAYHRFSPSRSLACSLYGLSAFAGCLGIVSSLRVPPIQRGLDAPSLSFSA
jgi:hypothetical protein